MAIYERMRVAPRGGALPEYQGRQAPYVPGQEGAGRIDDSSAQILGRSAAERDRALGNLGKSAKALVKAGVDVYDKYNKTKATELLTEYRREVYNRMYGEGGIMLQKGENGINAEDVRAKFAKEKRAELMKDKSELTKHYFNLLADDFDADQSEKTIRHGALQQVVMYETTNLAAADAAGEQAIANCFDLKDCNKNLALGLYHMGLVLDSKGISGIAKEKGLRDFSDRIYAGAISKAINDGNIAQAQRLLKEGGQWLKRSIPHDLDKAEGVVEKGNIDLHNRPVMKNEDGSISAVKTISANIDGKEVLLPTVSDVGKMLTEDEAAEQYMKTGKHFGKFDSVESANAYAWKLHENQEAEYTDGGNFRRMEESSITKAQQLIKSALEKQEAKAEKARIQAEQDKLEEEAKHWYDFILDAAKGFDTYEEREAKVIELSASIEDEDMRAQVVKAANAHFKTAERERKATIVSQAAYYDRQTEGMLIMDKLARMKELGATVDVLEYMRDRYDKAAKDNADAQTSYNNACSIRAEIDSARAELAPLSQNEIMERCYNYGLSSKDAEAVVNYGSKEDTYSYTRCAKLIKGVLGTDAKDEDVNAVYSALLKHPFITEGKLLDDSQIKEAAYKLINLNVVSAKSPEGFFGGLNTEKLGNIINMGSGEYARAIPSEAEQESLSMSLDERFPGYRKLTPKERDILMRWVYSKQNLKGKKTLTPHEQHIIAKAEGRI